MVNDENNYAAARIHNKFSTLKLNGPCETPVEKNNYKKRKSDIYKLSNTKMKILWKTISQQNFENTARGNKFFFLLEHFT